MKLRQKTFLFLTVVCLMLAAQMSAFAISKNELLRVQQVQSFQGICCFSWLEKVSATSPLP